MMQISAPIAEFVTVEYLWNANHSQILYEETGQFIVANNVITGIKVSATRDIFVTVPRWTSGVPATLNKLVPNPLGQGYVLDPWPSWEFQAINVTGALQNCQSMIIDSQNRMWIIEVGRRNFYDTNKNLLVNGPAGFFIVDVATGNLLDKHYFPNNIVPYNNSFVNDIVLDEVGGYAYFTNTWASGGIIVFNMKTNQSHMFVGPSTQRNSSYDFCANGICYGTDGVGASPSDGIALSSSGDSLYWSSVQGQALYHINTTYLHNFSLSNAQFQSHVNFLGFKTGCSDGMLWLNGNLYYGNIQESELGSVTDIDAFASSYTQSIPSTMTPSTPTTLNWIDTFAVNLASPNPDSSFYITTNKLNLFFSGAMDFSGQSGANFHIFQVAVAGDDDDAAASSSTALSAGGIFGIALSCFLVCVCLGVVVHRVATRSKGGDDDPLIGRERNAPTAGTSVSVNASGSIVAPDGVQVQSLGIGANA